MIHLIPKYRVSAHFPVITLDAASIAAWEASFSGANSTGHLFRDFPIIARVAPEKAHIGHLMFPGFEQGRLTHLLEVITAVIRPMTIFIPCPGSHQVVTEIRGKYSKNRFSLSVLNSGQGHLKIPPDLLSAW
jgi:hypothetical protein